MTDPEPVRKTSLLAKLGLGVVALAATFGYLIAILPDYGYEAAVLLNIGCGIFLLLLWAAPFRGPLRNWKLSSGLAMLACALIVAGALNMDRVEREVRTELYRIRHERLGVADGQRMREDDALGQELEKTFGYFHNNSRTPTSAAPDWSRRPATVKLIEEKQPGWPRALDGFYRHPPTDLPPRKAEDDRDSGYGGEPRMGCGHHWANSTVFGFTHMGYVSYALTVEKRLMARAESDREAFLADWKKLPPEERGEMVGK